MLPLSKDEQRRLDEIEQALSRDDPKFAANVSIGHARRRRRVVGDGAFLLGTVVLLAGLVDTAESTLTGVLISTAGLLMMAAAAATLLFRPRRH